MLVADLLYNCLLRQKASTTQQKLGFQDKRINDFLLYELNDREIVKKWLSASNLSPTESVHHCHFNVMSLSAPTIFFCIFVTELRSV